MATIKEQIRAEIERQRQFIEGLFTEGDNSFYNGQDDAYNHILSFLDTLPEQPVKGLEEEIEKIAYDLPTSDCMHDSEWTDAVEWVKEKFRHFAEWQKARDQKTIELAEDHAMLAGMNKMEQQMMEKAVEAEVYGCGDEMIPEISVELNADYKPGDKVRVIVIPNTDEK